MKRVLFILCSIPLLLFSPVSFANAQETSDFSKLNPEDYTNISLPPLDLLFENAKGGPIYELASVKEQIERKLLAKERRAVLSFFNIRGSYQWGKFGNDYTFSFWRLTRGARSNNSSRGIFTAAPTVYVCCLEVE